MDLMEQNKRLIKTQQQLIQSEKMATVGLLAAGIAHEINNPVNYINGGILVLRKSFTKFKRYFNAYKEIFNKSEIDPQGYPQLPDEQQIEKLIESSEDMFITIEEGIDKTTKIVQSIRVFSSNSENVFTEIDINAMLDHILKLLSGNYKDRIEIIRDYAPQSKIIGVSVNIQQIFVNLLTNAIQAIPEKGTIWIKIQQNEEQNSLIISIKDDGIGIDQKIKEKIFDPFFSTKDVGKGTGLGLYLTYRYIEQHHGKIRVISEPGKGTEFIISLPISKH
jgi:signal transduction histidine kinase